MREPLCEIRRADIIAITKSGRAVTVGGGFDDLIGEIKKCGSNAPVYTGERSPVCLMTAAGGELPLDTISGRKIYAFCGLANPSSFRETLSDLGAEITGFDAFKDHHMYGPGDLNHIRSAAKAHNADWIVTTEKDIIKLKPTVNNRQSMIGSRQSEGGRPGTRDRELPENLTALRIGMKIGEDFFTAIFRED